MKTLQNKLPVWHLAFIVGLQKTRSIVGNFTLFDANAILAKRKQGVPRHRPRAAAQRTGVEVEPFRCLKVVSVMVVSGENGGGGVPAVVGVKLIQTRFWVNRQELSEPHRDGSER